MFGLYSIGKGLSWRFFFLLHVVYCPFWLFHSLLLRTALPSPFLTSFIPAEILHGHGDRVIQRLITTAAKTQRFHPPTAENVRCIRGNAGPSRRRATGLRRRGELLGWWCTWLRAEDHSSPCQPALVAVARTLTIVHTASSGSDVSSTTPELVQGKKLVLLTPMWRSLHWMYRHGKASKLIFTPARARATIQELTGISPREMLMPAVLLCLTRTLIVWLAATMEGMCWLAWKSE